MRNENHIQPDHASETPVARGQQGIDLFSACPVSVGRSGPGYTEQVRSVARWSERHGYRGMLIYSDNRLVDPWMASQIVVQSTRSLAPLVAVQPLYMHPYTVAKMLATFASMHRRRLFVNWVAGGFVKDLEALADSTEHDARYDRLAEYATIVRRLTDGETVTFDGDYYSIRNLSLTPAIEPTLRPVYLLSGSSPAGQATARVLEARPVTYALPPEEDPAPPRPNTPSPGLRLGIISRAEREAAWRTAYRRFPVDRDGQLMRGLARKVSDSRWHEDLCQLADARADESDAYWTRPFENYKSMCPYIVGSHEEVAEALADYMRRGFRTFILDEPETEDDLRYAGHAFTLARQRRLAAA